MAGFDNSAHIPSAKSQQFNLKWTNYTSNILQVFSDHLLQESLVDVTLVCEGRLVKAHKIILSACSFYFREIFEVYTDRQPLIILNSVRFNVLKQLIEFMYRGEVKVQETDVEDLLQLAESLQVKGLCSVREKSGGVLPTTPGDEVDGGFNKDAQPPQMTSSTMAKEQQINLPVEATTTQALSSKNSSRRSSKDSSISLDSHQTSIKMEPGTSMDYNSGDDAPLVIDESGFSQENPLSDSDSTEPQAKKVRKSKDTIESNNTTTKPPRPPNAFMMFTNELRDQIKKEFPHESNKEISIRLGKLWKNLPQSEKDRYYEAASKAIVQYKAKYPTPTKSRKAPSPSSSKSASYFEPMQLVKLVMSDDKDTTSPNQSDTSKISSSIPNGNNKTTESSKT